MFLGQYYLSGYAACHWYFNPNIPEVQMLLQRYQGTIFTTSCTQCFRFIFLIKLFGRPISICLRHFVYIVRSYNSQEIKVRKVGAPLEAQPHLQIPKTTDLLTLREMQEIDPYEFPVSLFLFFLLSFLTAAKKLTM